MFYISESSLASYTLSLKVQRRLGLLCCYCASWLSYSNVYRIIHCGVFCTKKVQKILAINAFRLFKIQNIKLIKFFLIITALGPWIANIFCTTLVQNGPVCNVGTLFFYIFSRLVLKVTWNFKGDPSHSTS